MTLEQIEALAALARPINEADADSERQIDAENTFFDACVEVDAETFEADNNSEFSRFCLKATSEERIDEALKLIRAHFAASHAPGMR